MEHLVVLQMLKLVAISVCIILYVLIYIKILLSKAILGNPLSFYKYYYTVLSMIIFQARGKINMMFMSV